MKSSQKSEASKQKITRAAGEAFRSYGLGGVGVDGLAKRAQLTSGAFYFHFTSKLDAFIQSVVAGLEDLKQGIEKLQTADGEKWLTNFTSYYLGFKRTCNLHEGCTLPSLSAEVERAGETARLAYEAKLVEIVDVVSRGLPGSQVLTAREQAWVVLALLSGGVTMARAVDDPVLSEEIAATIQKAVGTIEN